MIAESKAKRSSGTSRAELLRAVAELSEVATAHAAESEHIRTLAPRVVAALRESELLGFAAPEAVGGGGHGPCVQLDVFEAMARIDTSSGWCLMISSMLAGVAGAYLPEPGAREVFSGRMPTFAGLIVPSGVLRPVRGGYRASGRWAFGSGIRHADWIVTGAAVLSEPGGAPGLPELRSIVVPTAEVTIEDTWHVAGLRGSGSEHYRMEDVFVPEQRSFAFPAAPAQRGGPAYDLPLVAFLSAAHAGFALGAARAALDAISELAPGRVKAWTGTKLAAHAAFHMDLGRNDAKLRAARAFVCGALAALEQRMQQALPLTLADWRDARLAVSWATDAACEVATFAFRAAGSTALYETSVIQRILRDVQAAAQHLAATDDAYEFAGRVLLGTAEPHLLLQPRMPRPDPKGP